MKVSPTASECPARWVPMSARLMAEVGRRQRNGVDHNESTMSRRRATAGATWIRTTTGKAMVDGRRQERLWWMGRGENDATLGCKRRDETQMRPTGRFCAHRGPRRPHRRAATARCDRARSGSSWPRPPRRQGPPCRHQTALYVCAKQCYTCARLLNRIRCARDAYRPTAPAACGC